MQAKLNQLKALLAEVADINGAMALLSWDMQTYMPPGGVRGRSYQRATLSRLAHLKFTSDEIGELLDQLQPYVDSLDPDSDEARLVKVTRRNYNKRRKVSPEWVAEFSQATSLANNAWQEARANNDFAHFKPYLERNIELRRAYASFFAPYEHVYDPLLDDFEPGMKTSEVQAIFSVLRQEQVALIQAIAEKPQVDSSFLHREFDKQKQWDFGVEVVTCFGYDWQHGRQDYTAHPFTTTFHPEDVRITTRIMPDFLPAGMFSTMHEAGHALYSLGLPLSLARSPLQGNASQAVSESQSRFWENIIGRSRAFWEHFYPRLQAYFPSQLGEISLDTFYRGINRVEPSLIRVEADEATYNLHIMLRMELEIALMEGSLEAADLPQAWNERMQAYLGLTPLTDSDGVLQDVHWAGGMVGYFPTYALGNLVSVQLYEAMQKDIPDLEAEVRSGRFEGILAWLREKIHRHGQKFEPQELVRRVTGSPIDPAPFVRYLKAKYGEIYGL